MWIRGGEGASEDVNRSAVLYWNHFTYAPEVFTRGGSSRCLGCSSHDGVRTDEWVEAASGLRCSWRTELCSARIHVVDSVSSHSNMRQRSGLVASCKELKGKSTDWKGVGEAIQEVF
jgi:hypothetical protein